MTLETLDCQPLFDSAKIAEIPTFQFPTGYADYSIVPPGFSAGGSQPVLQQQAVAGILVPEDDERRVRSAPEPDTASDVSFQVLLSLEYDISDSHCLGNNAGRQPFQHLSR